MSIWPTPIHSSMSNYFRNATKVFFLSIIAATTWVGCKKTSNVGLNILPQGDMFNLFQTDSFDLETYTVSEDSLRTDALTLNAIGQLNDPIFGKSISSAIFQTLLKDPNPALGTSPKFDSIVLSMPYIGSNGFYGDTASTQTWNVYQLNQDIKNTDPYYSNIKPSQGALLGSWIGHFRPTQNISLKLGSKTNTYIPHLRIKLDDNFGKSILANTTALASNESWLSFLKGLMIVPQSATGKGGIVYFYFPHKDGNLTVYYNDSSTLDFGIGTNNAIGTARISQYQHDHTGFQVAPAINKKTNSDDGYVQSMAGTKLWISIKDWQRISQQNPSSKVGVQGAELFLKVKQGTNTQGFEFPDKLLLVANDSGRNSFLFDRADALIGQDSGYSNPLGRYLGGYYDKAKGGYTFHLGRHMQHLFNEFQFRGVNKDYGFYVIIPTDNPMTASRLILDTNKNDGIKFKLTYTLSK
ncbi:MAG: DUF4270 family protein [Flavobacteriaceae bacterium]|nr:DUF4270 family protein [Flavobacteriaceae bacterium]